MSRSAITQKIRCDQPGCTREILAVQPDEAFVQDYIEHQGWQTLATKEPVLHSGLPRTVKVVKDFCPEHQQASEVAP